MIFLITTIGILSVISFIGWRLYELDKSYREIDSENKVLNSTIKVLGDNQSTLHTDLSRTLKRIDAMEKLYDRCRSSVASAQKDIRRMDILIGKKK